MPALAQTPDAQGRKVVAAAKMIEMLALRQVDQVSVAERPQVAGAVFIDTQGFGISARTVRLKRKGSDLSVRELAHAAARGDPKRAGTGNVKIGNKVAGQSVLGSEPRQPVFGQPVQT